VKDATPDGFGPHAAIITSPLQEGYNEAMAYIRPGGTVVAVGLPREGANLQADIFWTVVQSKTLTGSYVGNRLDAIEALRIAAAGHVKCPIVIRPFRELNKTFEEMEEGKLEGRVVLDRGYRVV
jgi:propanol-preferring alcohol dehydrogenase